MKRRVFVTKLRNPATEETMTVYGKYNPIAVTKQGFSEVVSSEFKTYVMSDDEVARYGKEID